MGGLKKKDMITWEHFSIPVSYRLGENRSSERLFDAQNVMSIQGRLDTRHGMSRLNSTALASTALSLSFFKDLAGNIEYIAKVGTTLVSISAGGALTTIKTGLNSSTKHTAITVNDRHLIACEADGLFVYDASGNFYDLGQSPPAVPTAVKANGGTLPDSDWRVKYTFYSTKRGYETNGSTRSAIAVTSSTDNQIDVSNMDTSAGNDPDMDKKRIYLQDVKANSDYLFIAEIAVATATHSITAESDSQLTIPTQNAPPGSGGGTFITEFDEGVAYLGRDTFEADLYISEPRVPDAYDDSGRGAHVNAPGQGEPTGLIQGYYNNDQQRPYLVITFAKSTHIYSKEYGLTTISKQRGCVSGRTMKTINGDVFMLSHYGWLGISNGQFFKKDGVAITLGQGDLDDVFKSSGYEKELNKSDMSNFFSVYYQELDQYITWISETGSTNKNRFYSYEFESGGFKPHLWNVNTQAAIEAEDSDGNEIIIFSDGFGYVFTHSIQEARTDQDETGANVDIEAFALIPWVQGDDMDASRNFRDFIVRASVSTNNIDVRVWLDFETSTPTEFSYSFPDPAVGFELDFSVLDVDAFGNDRTAVEFEEDLLVSGRSVLIGFYQTKTNGNLGLISAQLHSNKNGSRN